MKRKMKRILCLMFALFLLVGLVGCKKVDESATELTNQKLSQEENLEKEVPVMLEEGYNAGTYTATTAGHNGDITLEVEFSKDAIISVNVAQHMESSGISDPAFERIPFEVVEGQTLNVDTVAGATVSSRGILAAIEDCVSQAGGNAQALKTKEKALVKVGEEIEMTTDIVVVGAGGAGLTAAASAYEHGAEVIVLEKLAVIGGSTGLSGGGIAATGTRFQEEKGISDSKEAWMELWKVRQSTSNPDSKYPKYDVVDKFMDEAIITTEWLVDNIGHKYETISGFGMDPVERLHFGLVDKTTKGGTSLTRSVEHFLVDKNVKILTETPATELLTDEAGNIVGVLATSKDGTIRIHAKKVILAAGGFAKNEELLERFVPQAAGTSELTAASAGSTGDGIVMGEAVGGALYDESWVIGLGVASKVAGTGSLGFDWSKMYVNEKGERFTNEETHYSIATNRVIDQEQAWVVLDTTEVNVTLIETLEGAMPTEEVVKAETIEELAKAMNVPVESLVTTVKTYNEGAVSGTDSMGKSKNYVIAITNAPYYAVKIYPKTMGTFGGLQINENYNVIREDGSVINNLYAVGENANKALYNQVYMSGSAVQFAVTSGRLAGEHAAKNLK